MNTLQFEVPGPPIGQGRPRFSTVCGHVRAYDAEKSRNYKAYIALLATKAIEEQGWNVLNFPVMLEIRAYFAVPKSKSKAYKEGALSGKIMPTKKPDADNLAKAVLDALNGVAYKDDSAIIALKVSKIFSDVPRLEVSVSYVNANCS